MMGLLGMPSKPEAKLTIAQLLTEEENLRDAPCHTQPQDHIKLKLFLSLFSLVYLLHRNLIS